MTKKCFACAHFTAYYAKGYCCFFRTDCGHCRKQNQTVEKHSTCENWKIKYYPDKIKKAAVLEGLRDALVKLNSIKLILDENEEDRNNLKA